MVTEHAICALPDDHPDWRHLVIRVQRRVNTDHWVLNHCGYCFNHDGAWYPHISEATQCTEDTALRVAELQSVLVDVNGMTAADLLARSGR